MEGKFVLLTDETQLRAYDYKLSDEFKESDEYDPTKGIELFMTATVSDERVFIQAAGRVGRNREACNRYVLTGLKPFRQDETQNFSEVKKLLMK